MDKEVGKWFVGYGQVGDVGVSPLTTFWPGNYVYIAQRAPSYSNTTLKLTYSAAEAVINAGNDNSSSRAFKTGDVVAYNTTRYSTVLSVWVRK